MRRSGKGTAREAYSTSLRKAIRTHLPQRGLALVASDRRTRWTPRVLASLAILMTWHSAGSLREAFAAARDVVVAMYPTRRRPGKHLEGYLKALRKQSGRLLDAILPNLRASTERLAGKRWRWNGGKHGTGWVLIGVDGSRINCPRTAANEAVFGCAGRKKTGPQQQLTTLFHLATGLVWSWRRGYSDASERHQLRDMLGELPEKTLLLADAGFTGYELLSELQARGHAFLVRAGRNVHLLNGLGWEVDQRRDRVYLWPQKHRDRPPLVLRLISLCREGKRMALLTNLDCELLSDQEAECLYRQWWELELMYRSLKQTMNKRTLRSAAPALAEVELDWAMLGLWLLGLMTVEAAGLGQPWSPGGALKATRTAMRQPRRPVGRQMLRQHLRAAIRDGYERRGSKKARNWPHKKTEQPPGTPNLRMATQQEVAAAQRFKHPDRAA